jgi:hypothetical protein
MARILTKTFAALAATAGTALLVGACSSSDPSGTETFSLVTHQIVGNPAYRVVASGVFSATGTMQSTGTASNAPMKATFPGGTLMLSGLTDSKPSATINSKTCAVAITETGAKYKVTDGTGDYKGISGSGTATIKITGVLPKLSNGKCNTSVGPSPMAGTVLGTVRASGPISMP